MDFAWIRRSRLGIGWGAWLGGFALCCGLVLSAHAAELCEDCYDGPTIEVGGTTWYDANCCWSDLNQSQCAFAQDPEYTLKTVNKEYCGIQWVEDEGYRCDSQTSYCNISLTGPPGGGGVGGGGSGCTIQWGTLCPATCFSCNSVPFLT